eukprot:scaffold112007_cov39-Prasinocladus_malaysianus.AAC.1
MAGSAGPCAAGGGRIGGISVSGKAIEPTERATCPWPAGLVSWAWPTEPQRPLWWSTAQKLETKPLIRLHITGRSLDWLSRTSHQADQVHDIKIWIAPRGILSGLSAVSCLAFGGPSRGVAYYEMPKRQHLG